MQCVVFCQFVSIATDRFSEFFIKSISVAIQIKYVAEEIDGFADNAGFEPDRSVICIAIVKIILAQSERIDIQSAVQPFFGNIDGALAVLGIIIQWFLPPWISIGRNLDSIMLESWI